jgi:diguanylate cyclase (GGDEF)-like protein
MADEQPADRSLLAVIEVQNEIIAADLDFDAALRLITVRAREITGADSAAIELVEDGRSIQAAVAGSPVGNAGSTLGVAIRHEDGVAGLLKVETTEASRFTADDFEALELLGGVIAVRLSTGTMTGSRGDDPLTGMPNRRAFAGRLAVEASRARRHGHQLALCIFDLHGLAAVNQHLGRQAGDEVLKRVAQILSRSRLDDEFFRLGGDQFAILLPQTSADGAEAAGARLSASIVAAGLADGRISASFGAATTAGDPVALHEQAGERLRLAKKRRAASRPRRPDGSPPRVVAVVRPRHRPLTA